MSGTPRDELAARFPDATESRLETIEAALAEMRSDAALLAGESLSFLEPLVLPTSAERWIENGGTLA